MCTTFYEATHRRGLIGTDAEWVEVLTAFAYAGTPSQLMETFAFIFLHCEKSNALDLCMQFRDEMAHHYVRATSRAPAAASLFY